MPILRKLPLTPSAEPEMALVRTTIPPVRGKQMLATNVTSAGSGHSGPEVHLLESLERHWRFALAIFLVVAMVGSAEVYSRTQPIFGAEATVFIPTDLNKDASIPYQTMLNQQVISILQYEVLSDGLRRAQAEHLEWRLKGETERQAVQRLRDSLDVQRIPDSFEIAIHLVNRNPRLAAGIPNAVAKAFVAAANRPDARIDEGGALQLERTSLETQMRKDMQLRSDLTASLQVLNLQSTSRLPDDEVLTQMRQALASAHQKRLEAEEQLAAGPGTLAFEAEQIASSDPASRSIENNLLQRQFELRERIKTMLPTHPVRKEAEAELALIGQQLQKGVSSQAVADVTNKLISKLRAQADEARRVEDQMSADITKVSTTLPGRANDLAQAEMLTNEITRLQDEVNHVKRRIDEISNQAAESGAVRIFSVADLPVAPLPGRRVKGMGLVFGLALLLGLGLPVLLDLSDTRIYNPSTIERLLGFPVVGMTLLRNTKTERFADEHLKRLISGIERGITEGAKTILLMGLKQTVAPSMVNAISTHLSERRINVTVGAADSDALLGLNGGTPLIGPGASLTNDLLDLEVLLLEAPPLVFSADAERLAASADMTLLIVEAGKNTRPELLRGARVLERLNVPSIGVILQDVQIERAGRPLRRDLKEYTAAAKNQFGRLTGTWDGGAFV